MGVFCRFFAVSIRFFDAFAASVRTAVVCKKFFEKIAIIFRLLLK